MAIDQRALTGVGSEVGIPALMNIEDLAEHVDNGDGVTSGTLPDIQIGDWDVPDFIDQGQADYGLVPQHEYYVTDVDVANNTVTVRNPHGWTRGSETDGTTVMSFDEFQQYMGLVSTNELEEEEEQEAPLAPIPQRPPTPPPSPTPNSTPTP